MRKFCLLLPPIFLATLFGILTPVCSKPLPDAEIKKLHDNCKRAILRSCHDGLENGRYTRGVDHRCFSSKDVRIYIAVTRNDDGTPKLQTVLQEGTDADLFYCQQSIWESSPKIFEPMEGFSLCQFYGGGQSWASCELAPDENSKNLKMHSIPLFVVTEYNFRRSIVRNDDFIVEIKPDQINDPRLQSFRRDWMDFFRTHQKASVYEVFHQAAKIRRKYKDFLLAASRTDESAFEKNASAMETRYPCVIRHNFDQARKWTERWIANKEQAYSYSSGDRAETLLKASMSLGKGGDWSCAKQYASEAIQTVEQAHTGNIVQLGDLYFLRALFYYKARCFQESLEDLKTLYQLAEKSPEWLSKSPICLE